MEDEILEELKQTPKKTRAPKGVRKSDEHEVIPFHELFEESDDDEENSTEDFVDYHGTPPPLFGNDDNDDDSDGDRALYGIASKSNKKPPP